MAKEKPNSAPYPPSWMDKFFDWVERLPFPYPWFYFALYLFLVFSQHIVLWLDETLAIGQFAAIVFMQNVWFVFIGALWHFARVSATAAIQQLRTALEIPNRELEEVIYRFTRLPRRSGLLITLAGAVILVAVLPLFQSYYGPLFFSPFTKYTTLVLAFVILPFNFGALYSVVRMLLAIDGIYGRVRRINLFNLTPLYALSGFTSRMGMVLLVFLLLNLLTPYLVGSTAGSVDTFYAIVNSVSAVLVFILPLLGVHRRLVADKSIAVEANNDLIEAGFATMQNLVRAGKHAEVSELRSSNLALLDYRQELAKISTWPWAAGTLRTFLTALAVPMTVWVVQQVLLRIVVK